jgi:hypothetical protein
MVYSPIDDKWCRGKVEVREMVLDDVGGAATCGQGIASGYCLWDATRMGVM